MDCRYCEKKLQLVHEWFENDGADRVIKHIHLHCPICKRNFTAGLIYDLDWTRAIDLDECSY